MGDKAMGDKAKKAKKGDKAKGKKAKQAEPTVAGIVEDLREAGAKLAAAANSPAGREAIALGLSIAATAAQAAITAKRPKAKAAPAGGEPADAAPPRPHSAAQDALVAALGGVADTVLAKFLPKKS